ncbi:MAG: SGNH/GDSL hydrolase family protein [Candidatus Omnitrophota bacterium]|nr:MAG: SGNH/GDSL hydrolase family protein [Candidatus Omnitrophota bacterium]
MKNASKNIALFIFSMFLCFIVLEVSLRIYNPFQWRIKRNKIILPVNRVYVFDNIKIDKLDKKITHTKNSLGFRGENPPKDLNDYLSIIIVGGSTAECFYLSDNKAWPYLTSQKLKKTYEPIWLNNAGLAGHSTFGHLILLKDYLTELKPKIIIFMIGANDIARDDLNRYDKVTLRGRYSSLKNFIVKNSEVAFATANVVRVFKAQKMGVTHRSLNIAESDKLEISKEKIESELKRHKKEYVDAYKKRLLQIISTSRENGIEPIFVTQPMLCGDEVDNFTGVYLGNVKISDSINGKLYWKVTELYNNATEEIANRTGTFVIDLANKMPKNSLYFYDNWHYTNEGAEKASKIVYAELNKYLDRNYEVFKKKNLRR